MRQARPGAEAGSRQTRKHGPGKREKAGSDADGSARRGRRIIYVPLAMAAVLSAAAAYAITARPDPISLASGAQAHARAGSRAYSGSIAAAPDKPRPAAAGNAASGRAATLNGEELRNAFRKRLSDADLLRRFDLALDDKQWSMKAALDDEEAARFERILAAFITEHAITFPVHAQVGSAESMLPFKIRQVISGANASVVTQEGDRLYVGDEYRGVRLVSVNGSRVVFSGKRQIEVRW